MLDEQIARIKGYAIVINSSLTEEDELLDFVIADVVDRAIVYMNRQDRDEEDQLPEKLERALATSVVGVYRTVQNAVTATTGAISSASDNGQSVSFSDKMTSYLTSADDADIFSATVKLLNKFRLPTVNGIT